MSGDGRRRTRVLDDRPTDEDGFASPESTGAHRRVADAIIELINGDEPGGMTIGLEGRWGAGKSSILKMVARGVESPQRTVILFDAWAHEGDPLRRTFLETLIRALSAAHFIDGTRWESKAAELAGRLVQQTATTSRKVKRLGRIFALSAVGVPFGTALVSSALQQGATFVPTLGSPLAPKLLIGSAVALAPAAVALGNWFRIKMRGTTSEDDWDLTSQNSVVRTVSETSETSDPTSLEFERTFEDLMKEALSVSTRQVVLIVDNLDRVEPSTALNLWSAMQTFIQDRDVAAANWFERLWILVPFSTQGIAQLWARTNATESSSLAGSFIDKTFPIRFSVPPAALSNWHAFLLRLLAIALPDHEETDRERVYRAFESCRPANDPSPTPRELKRFVNDLGCLHRQWGSVFPLEQMAYFAVLARRHGDLQSQLVGGQLPPKEAIAVLGEALPATMAALLFNVDAKLGQQLLLRGPALASLRAGDADAFAKLVEDHGDRLRLVVESIGRGGNIGGDTLQGLVGAARCFADERLDTWTQQQRFEDIRRTLGLEALSRREWDLADRGIAPAVPALLRLVRDQKVSAHVFQEIRWLTKISEHAATWIAEKSLSLLEEATRLGHQDAIRSGIRTGLTGLAWFPVASEIRRLDPAGRFWRSVHPADTPEQVRAGLDAGILAGQDTTGYADTLALCATDPTFDVTPTIRAIEQRFDPANNASEKEFRELLRCLDSLRLADAPAVDALLSRLSKGGQLLHFLHAFRKIRELAAVCVSEFLAADPGAARPPAVGNSAAGYDRLSELLAEHNREFAGLLVQYLRSRDRLGLVVAVPAAKGTLDPLFGEAWRLISSSERAYEVFTPEVIAANWQRLKDTLGDDFQGFLARAVATAGLCEYFIARHPDGPVHDEGGLDIEILRLGSTPSAFLAWCGQSLKGLDKDAWIRQLAQRGPAVERLLELAKQRAVPPLSFAFSDALGHQAEIVRIGTTGAGDMPQEQWQTVIACAGERRSSFRSELLRQAAKLEGRGGGDFLRIFGEELIEASIETDNASTVVRDVLEPGLSGEEQQWLEWLLALFLAAPDYLNRAGGGSSASRDFRARLAELLERGTQAEPLLRRIAEAVGG